MGEQLFNVSPAEIFARPTADRIWLGPSQQEALSQLSGAARAVLLGPVSSGKTCLLKHLAASLDDAVVFRLSGPLADAGSVLVQLLQAAELSPWDLSEVEQRNLFSVFVLQRRAQGRDILLIVDKVERIASPALEEIHRLQLMSFRNAPALRLLLCADSTAAARTNANSADADAATVVYRLERLTGNEVAEYVDWRLQRFGLSQLFSDAALELIARATQGRFGGIDVMCQMSLLLLRQRGQGCVDAKLAQQAVAALAERQRLGTPSEDGELDAALRPAEPPSGKIIATRDGEIVARRSLGERLLIGRSEHNDLCLSSPYLSRHHAVIIGTSDGYYIVDLNSVNGLVLNGEPVGRAILRQGDVLGLGPFRLKVELSGAVAHGSPMPVSLDETLVMPVAALGARPTVRVVK